MNPIKRKLLEHPLNSNKYLNLHFSLSRNAIYRVMHKCSIQIPPWLTIVRAFCGLCSKRRGLRDNSLCNSSICLVWSKENTCFSPCIHNTYTERYVYPIPKFSCKYYTALCRLHQIWITDIVVNEGLNDINIDVFLNLCSWKTTFRSWFVRFKMQEYVSNIHFRWKVFVEIHLRIVDRLIIYSAAIPFT